MSDLHQICKQCKLCSFMPEQITKPQLSWVVGPQSNPVLVIDEMMPTEPIEGYTHGIAQDLLDREDFDYTYAIRCNHAGVSLKLEEMLSAISRCAVWTNLLLDERKVIVSTLFGLQQMKLEKERKVGDMFKCRYGIVMVVPPLWKLARDGDQMKLHQAKAQRVLKEAKL